MKLTNSYILFKKKTKKIVIESNLHNPLIHEQHNLLLSACLFLAPDPYCCKLFALGVAVVLDYHILLLGNLSVIFFLRFVAESKRKIITLFTHMYIYNIYIYIFHYHFSLHSVIKI